MMEGRMLIGGYDGGEDGEESCHQHFGEEFIVLAEKSDGSQLGGREHRRSQITPLQREWVRRMPAIMEVRASSREGHTRLMVAL